METISILAGGWSAQKHVMGGKLPGTVVGVNDACIHYPCDMIVSMDRLWVESRWPTILGLSKPTYLRRKALMNIPPNWPGYVHAFECNHESAEMNDEPNQINGTNSGMCAVSLAYKIGPGRICVFGMDLSVGPHGERHWWPDYTWANPAKSYPQKWKRDLDIAIKQCQAKGIKVELMK